MEVGRATTDIKLSEAAASAAFSFGLVPQLLLFATNPAALPRVDFHN
jgi:hypothetical protein